MKIIQRWQRGRTVLCKSQLSCMSLLEMWREQAFSSAMHLEGLCPTFSTYAAELKKKVVTKKKKRILFPYWFCDDLNVLLLSTLWQWNRVRQEGISGVPFKLGPAVFLSSWVRLYFPFPRKVNLNNKLTVPLAPNFCDSKRENLPWGDQQNLGSVTDSSPRYTKFKI